MKYTIERKRTDEVKYPCLMEGQTGLLVLMNEDRSGTIVGCTSGGFLKEANIGKHMPGWTIQSFKPFNGTLTLQND